MFTSTNKTAKHLDRYLVENLINSFLQYVNRSFGNTLCIKDAEKQPTENLLEETIRIKFRHTDAYIDITIIHEIKKIYVKKSIQIVNLYPISINFTSTNKDVRDVTQARFCQYIKEKKISFMFTSE